MNQSIDKLLVCPVSKATLVLNEAKTHYMSEKAKLAYPIDDGIPVLMPQAAISLESIKP